MFISTLLIKKEGFSVTNKVNIRRNTMLESLKTNKDNATACTYYVTKTDTYKSPTPDWIKSSSNMVNE